jgi:hypothetical protein
MNGTYPLKFVEPIKGRTGGFYANRELARIAGAKDGRISRRRKADVNP